MNDDRSRPTGPRAVPDETPADKSPRALNNALDTLEELLESSDDAQTKEEPEPDRDPHTLSLLDAIEQPVEEGHEIEPEQEEVIPPPSIADDAAYQQLADRLASELEIIVQTGVSDAMQQASETIMARVKDHLDIMLPEILQELADIESRK